MSTYCVFCWALHPCPVHAADCAEHPPPHALLQSKASATTERKRLAGELRLERAGRERAEDVLRKKVSAIPGEGRAGVVGGEREHLASLL